MCLEASPAESFCAMIKGVPWPTVLRRKGETGFKVVGQPYFFGFMNGEVFEIDNMKEDELILV